MMWRELFGGRKSGLERIEQHVLDMLDADRHTFDLATNGLLGAADPGRLRQEASDSDHRVNMLVQQVRRELVVHASLHGAQVDTAVMFATMSIVKDIERIGDYAKRLLRVARVRGPFTPDTDEHAQIAAYTDRIAEHLTDVRETLGVHDPDRASTLLSDLQALTDEITAAIDRLLAADPTPGDGAARALTYHFLARVSAHLGNVLTSLVLPLDKLDFYDEQHAGQSEAPS